jgi:hypothetical protein
MFGFGEPKHAGPPMLKFSVGGSEFAVSADVLRRGGANSKLLAGSRARAYDRSPSFFQLLLDFLRYGYVPSSERKRRALAIELDFFNVVPPLVPRALEKSLIAIRQFRVERYDIDASLPPDFQPHLFDIDDAQFEQDIECVDQVSAASSSSSESSKMTAKKRVHVLDQRTPSQLIKFVPWIVDALRAHEGFSAAFELCTDSTSCDDVATLVFAVPSSNRLGEEDRSIAANLDRLIAERVTTPHTVYIVAVACGASIKLPQPLVSSGDSGDINRATVYIAIKNVPNIGGVHDNDHNKQAIDTIVSAIQSCS